MKKSLIFICVAAWLVACKTNDKKAAEAQGADTNTATAASVDSANFTQIQWIDSIDQDLGKVKEGTVVEVKYRFKNVGSTPLIIEDVTAGCGCTVPEKPEQPFAPGEEGFIRAKFDSRGREGTNNKYVTVTANTKPEKQQNLLFKVEVIK